MSRTPAMAVAASDGQGRGVVVWHLGMGGLIDAGLRELVDVGLDDCPLGVHVWEGALVWTHFPSTPNGPAEDDFELVGEWRTPTLSELSAAAEGVNPLRYAQCQQCECECEEVAQKDGLCEQHYFQANPGERVNRPGLTLDLTPPRPRSRSDHGSP